MNKEIRESNRIWALNTCDTVTSVNGGRKAEPSSSWWGSNKDGGQKYTKQSLTLVLCEQCSVWLTGDEGLSRMPAHWGHSQATALAAPRHKQHVLEQPFSTLGQCEAHWGGGWCILLGRFRHGLFIGHWFECVKNRQPSKSSPFFRQDPQMPSKQFQKQRLS